MGTNLNGIYSIRSNAILNNDGVLPNNQYATPLTFYDDAEKIVNGLMALGNYATAYVRNTANVDKNQSLHGRKDDELFNEAIRLKKDSKAITFDELKQEAKFAVIVNNAGRLMVDGNLFNGVLKFKTGNEEKYIEYKLGNPVVVLSEYTDDAKKKGKVALKLTKYEYCKLNPYVTKTEKSLIYEDNWDNPESCIHLAVPFEIQQQAGITNADNFIRNTS